MRIKAHNGNRSKNLLSIADKIDSVLDGAQKIVTGDCYLSPKDQHTIKGYMEQLRIIADEINPEGK